MMNTVLFGVFSRSLDRRTRFALFATIEMLLLIEGFLRLTAQVSPLHLSFLKGTALVFRSGSEVEQPWNIIS
jgi:hypothetical protein